MKNKFTLSVLVLCCAGGLAQAQFGSFGDFSAGIHVGPYAPGAGPWLISFGDNAPPNTVYIGEALADNTMVLNAARFNFQNGRVGIGMPTPGSLLTIFDAANPVLELNNGTGRSYMSKLPGTWAGLTSPFVLQADSSGDMVMTPVLNSPESGIVIKQNGRVGIGTTDPQAKLEVYGAALFRNGNSYLGTIVNVQANQANEKGGGIAIGANGGFFDYNDGFVTYMSYNPVGVGGLKVAANFNVTGNVNMGGDVTVQGRLTAQTLLLTSDRQAKTNFHAVDSRDILKKLAALDITTWHYTNAPGVRHLGPMAQDFKAAFNLGEDDKHIATVDADGVALASIQALYEIVQEKNSEIAALQLQVSALKTELAGVKDSVTDRMAALEKAMSKDVLQASFRPEAAR